MDQQVILDGIKWWIKNRDPQPLCPIHHLRLSPKKGYYKGVYDEYSRNAHYLECQECKQLFSLPRDYSQEKQYVLDKIDAKIFKNLRFINLDDEAIPIAEDKKSSEDDKFFVTSRLMKSKTGLRLIVYAGEKGKKEKTQIFVEPEIKRLSFDQKDLYPTDVFTKLEATFSDGTKGIISKDEEK